MKRVIALIIFILMILCLAACSSELKYYCADKTTPANQNSMPRSGYIDMILICDSGSIETPTDMNSGYISNSDLCLVDELGSPHLFTSIDVINPTFTDMQNNGITLRCKFENLEPGTYTISCTDIYLVYNSENDPNEKTQLLSFFTGNQFGLSSINGTTITITDINDIVEEVVEEENDPEVEIDFGFGPVTVKTSNKSLVLNDKKIVETEVLQSENLFVPFDLSNTPVKLDGLFLNNDVYQYISGVGKGIELETRFAKADVFKKDNIGQNPLSLHLSDVSEVAGTCATAIQKKAMNTNKVYAEVNYSFVTNGNPTDNNARIYVPVDGEAKVFFIINENTLGSIPCETRNGYCVFNRYMDGTYVICAK